MATTVTAPKPNDPDIGLALSGGGFRAAFFHVGVLARMAEIRLLSRVDVLSTVSGGSMVGALYYVKLWSKLAGGNPLTDEQYLDLVAELAADLRTAVQRNLRARVFLNPFKNVEMLARTSYSRSDRIGDLLDRMFYAPSWAPTPEKRYGLINKQIELRELKLSAPRPKLVMNATSLNTGHAWRFEPIGMGEQPVGPPPLDRIDRNEQLAWGYFEQTGSTAPITSTQRDFPLGLAVAASGGFPGLVAPLAITGLYEGRVVRLMDGGAHDNQGIEALTFRRCKYMIVSDASGQMGDLPSPKSFLPTHLFRINSIYGDRVREEQLRAADWDKNVLLHLKEGLESHVEWPLDDAGNKIDPPRDYESAAPVQPTGVHSEVQLRLAHIRTDLDAFNDLEIESLIRDGYLLATQHLRDSEALAPANPRVSSQVESWVAQPTEDYLRKLELGKKTLFKVTGLIPTAVKLLAGALLAVAALVAVWRWWDELGDFIHSMRWGRAILLAGAAIAAPAVAARLLGIVLGPKLLARKPGPKVAWIARWTPIVLWVAICALLIYLACRFAPTIAGWLRVNPSRPRITIATAAILAAPALLPFFLALSWLAGGRLYLKHGSLQN
jgi:NTE family protein